MFTPSYNRLSNEERLRAMLYQLNYEYRVGIASRVLRGDAPSGSYKLPYPKGVFGSNLLCGDPWDGSSLCTHSKGSK